jgi:hypothetical protein
MKKLTFFIILAVLVTFSAAMAAQYTVITKEAPIRKDNRFFAPVVARLPYGTAVTDQARKGDWLRVTYQGKTGWIHVSAVQEQKIQLIRSGRAREAGDYEVALAGKGFTPEVENAFRGKNPTLQYGLVDQIQSYMIDDAQLQAFIEAGNLNEPGGVR